MKHDLVSLKEMLKAGVPGRLIKEALGVLARFGS
jgi:hypothetical protein